MVLTSVGSAQAQTLADTARFNVPFDFAFGETKLPAGKYTIRRAMPSSGDTMLSITDRDGHWKAIVLSHATMKLRPNTKATLVFHRYGDRYFLTQIWPANAEIGREFPQSKLEREVRSQQQPAIVRVYLNTNDGGNKLASK